MVLLEKISGIETFARMKENRMFTTFARNAETLIAISYHLITQMKIMFIGS